MTLHNLHAEAHRHSALRDELVRRFPEMESDTQLLADSLEGFSSLIEEVAAVARSIDEDQILLTGIAERMGELRERFSRIELRVENKKAAILHAMTESGEKCFQLPTCTISTRNNPPSVVVTDESLVPDDYKIWPDPPPPKVDKKIVLQLLKDGKQIPGCAINNGSVSLSFRVK